MPDNQPELLMGQRNGQDFKLGLGRGAATATVALEATIQTDGMLMDFTFLSTQQGLLSDLKISGQSLFCSDVGVDVRGFDPQALMEGHRTIGIPLASSLPVRVEGTLAAAGTFSAQVGVDPCDPRLVQPINALPPEMLAYVFGMGSVTLAAGADGVLVGVARRKCRLGRLFLSGSASPEDLTVRGISINQTPMLAGNNAAGSATAELGVGDFDPFATDSDGLVLGKWVRPNESVIINIHNYNAGALTIRGGIFCLPPQVVRQ